MLFTIQTCPSSSLVKGNDTYELCPTQPKDVRCCSVTHLNATQHFINDGLGTCLQGDNFGKNLSNNFGKDRPKLYELLT